MIPQNSKEEMIKLYPLVCEPLIKRKNEVYCSILLSLLSIENRKRLTETFSIDEVRELIKKETGIEMDNALILTNILDLKKDGIIIEPSPNKYKIEKEIQLKTIDDIYKPSWLSFLEYLDKLGVDIDITILPDKKYLHFFHSALNQIFHSIIISRNFNFSIIDRLMFEDRDSFLKIAEINSIEKTMLNHFLSYLTIKPEPLIKLISKMYLGSLNVELIRRRKELNKFSEKYLKNDIADGFQFIISDTSFIISLLCDTDKTNLISNYCMDLLIKYNIPCYLVKETREEMNGLIYSSEKEIRTIRRKKAPMFKNQIIEDFIKNKKYGWSEYIEYISNWELYIKTKYGIIEMPIEHVVDIDKTIYDYTKCTIPIMDKIRKESRPLDPEIYKNRKEKPIEHDAYIFGLISALRQKNLTLGPWFLTFDTLISATDIFYKETYQQEYGMVIHPRTVMNYILVFSGIDLDEKEIDKLGMVILQYIIGDIKNITLEEYSKLFTLKGEKLIETDANIILELFIKSPFRRELEEALESSRGDIADDIALQIVTDEAYVNTIIKERDTKERLNDLVTKYQEQDEELQKTKFALKEVKEMKSNTGIKLEQTVNINIEIEEKMDSIINVMENLGLFNNGIIKKPVDKKDKSAMKKWLQDIKYKIETFREYKEFLYLIPLIVELKNQLG